MGNRSLFTGFNPPYPTFLRPILKSTTMGWGWIAVKGKEGSPTLDWWEANTWPSWGMCQVSWPHTPVSNATSGGISLMCY